MKIYQNPGFLQRGIDFSPPEALRNVCTAFFTFLAILRNDETRDKLNYLANLGKEACAKFRVFCPLNSAVPKMQLHAHLGRTIDSTTAKSFLLSFSVVISGKGSQMNDPTLDIECFIFGCVESCHSVPGNDFKSAE